MKIINNRLYFDDDRPVPFVPSPNCEGVLQPQYLVMHYTAGPTAKAAVGQLTNPQAKVSAHLVIGRDGSITQLVPFDKIAWHAGKSAWAGLVNLNPYSFGIELDNAGRMVRQEGEWQCSFGAFYNDSQVMETYHKFGKVPYGWHIYSPEQIATAIEAGTALFQEFKLLDVVGHDDIAPTRKVDPGPAFPMHHFRAQLRGLSEEIPPLYGLMASTYVREGAGVQYKSLLSKMLPKNTRLGCLQFQGSWMKVQVLDVVEGIADLQGWVHTRYVKQQV